MTRLMPGISSKLWLVIFMGLLAPSFSVRGEDIDLRPEIEKIAKILAREEVALSESLSRVQKEKSDALYRMETYYGQLRDKTFAPGEFFPFVDALRAYEYAKLKERQYGKRLKLAQEELYAANEVLKTKSTRKSSFSIFAKELAKEQKTPGGYEGLRGASEQALEELLKKSPAERTDEEINQVIDLEDKYAAAFSDWVERMSRIGSKMDLLGNSAVAEDLEFDLEAGRQQLKKTDEFLKEHDELSPAEGDAFATQVTAMLFQLNRPEIFCLECIEKGAGTSEGRVATPEPSHQDIGREVDAIFSIEIEFYESVLSFFRRQLTEAREEMADAVQALEKLTSARDKTGKPLKEHWGVVKAHQRRVRQAAGDAYAMVKDIPGVEGALRAYKALRRDWFDSPAKIEERIEANQQRLSEKNERLGKALAEVRELLRKPEYAGFVAMKWDQGIYFKGFEIMSKGLSAERRAEQQKFIESTLAPYREELDALYRDKKQLEAELQVLRAIGPFIQESYPIFDPNRIPSERDVRFTELKKMPPTGDKESADQSEPSTDAETDARHD